MRDAELAGKSVAVVGLGRSGDASARALVELGARVRLIDRDSRDSLGEEFIARLASLGAEPCLDREPAESLQGSELVIASPGVPKSAPILVEAQRLGLPIWSEIELAWRLTRAPVAAVTGTNGKTTTTLLIRDMLVESGQQAIACGNISADEVKRPMVEAAMAARAVEAQRRQRGCQATPLPVLVTEVSSFQLEWVSEFAPNAAVLTNITLDHLNRHASFEDYMQAKAAIFKRQQASDLAVVNADCSGAVQAIRSRAVAAAVCWFSARARRSECAAWLADGKLMAALPGLPETQIMPASELPQSLPGLHSVENVLAAAAAAIWMGARPEAVRSATRRFPGVPHRMELVAEIEGVQYRNNSMCTNVAAAVSSLEALDRPAIVIAGGADKGLDFAPLGKALAEHGARTILIGQAADAMERAFRSAGCSAIWRAGTLADAALQARDMARPGDVVILSPACASFDMFVDFEDRGARFRKIVKQWQQH